MKFAAIAVNATWCPRQCHPHARRHQDEANRQAKRGECVELRQHRKIDDSGEGGGKQGTDHKAHRGRVSLVGARREQNDADSDKDDRRPTTRPLRENPEQHNRADRDKSPAAIDEWRQPIGCPQPPRATRVANRARAARDHHDEYVEQVRQGGTKRGGPIRQQPRRWRCGRQRAQRRISGVAYSAQGSGRFRPICRAVRPGGQS